MLAEGIYKGKIKEWGFGESSQKKAPYFEVVANLTHVQSPNGELEELEIPFRRATQMYLNGGALSITAANIRALGYTDQSLQRLNPGHPEYHDLLDQEVWFTVQHETYLDKKTGIDREKEKVQLLRKSPRLEGANLETALSKVDDIFGAEQRRVAEKKRAERADNEDDKDIPF